jgi:hypothetical protein
MTSAGSAQVAYAPETKYLGALKDSDGDGTPEYFQPFKDITVGEASLDNALSRIRDPDSAEPVGSIAQNFSGALNVSGTLADQNWLDLVFNDGGTGFTTGRMPSSSWFLGVDYLDGTCERVAKGAVVTQADINYQQGSNVTVDLQLIYGDESKNTSLTPSNIQTPTSSDVYAGHGAELSVSGTGQTKLQSATLSLPTGARFHRGADRHPVDAVIGEVNPELTADATFTGPDTLEVAYGGTTPASMLSSVDGSLSFTNGAGTTLTFNLTGMKPNNYNWADLVSADTDLGEPTTYFIDSVGVV